MRTVVVTGASSGLGREIAHQFLANGDQVVLTARRADRLVEVAQGFPLARIVPGDIRDPLVQNDIMIVCAEGIDILVNNAAVYDIGNFEELSIDTITWMLDTDLTAPIVLTRLIYREMIKRRSGTVVNISSSAAIRPSVGETLYSAAKAGLLAFSKALRLEAKQYNVEVLDLVCGAMQTGMLAHRQDRERMIDPLDVAQMVVDLSYRKNTFNIEQVVLGRRY